MERWGWGVQPTYIHLMGRAVRCFIRNVSDAVNHSVMRLCHYADFSFNIQWRFKKKVTLQHFF